MADQGPIFYYKGTPVRIDDTFRMSGALVASVTAEKAVFSTDGRYPGRPTRYGWVRATDLQVQPPLPVASSVARTEVGQ